MLSVWTAEYYKFSKAAFVYITIAHFLWYFFSDEGSRPDRQPEFTQLDIELSFTDRESIFQLIENTLVHCWPKDHQGEVKRPFARITYNEAMEKYGTDKPDTRVDVLTVTTFFNI